MNIDNNTCWYKEKSIQEMNLFCEKFVKHLSIEEQKKQFYHLSVFENHLKIILNKEIDNEKILNIIDLGCGTGAISQIIEQFNTNESLKFNYNGCDLPLVIIHSATVNFPQYFYKYCDLTNNDEDLTWINKFDVVILNGVIDIMQYPINILSKILENCGNYIIIHRQEITSKNNTHTIKNDSYGGYTYHSIINKNELFDLIELYNFDIINNQEVGFSNWENNGNSLLLKRKRSYSLYNIDHKLTKIFNNKCNGTFIDVGANDGITQSNTYFLEHFKNWTGILIEPVQEIYEKCLENRSKASICINAAIVNDSYDGKTIEMIYTNECNGLMSVINDNNANELMKRTKEDGKLIDVRAMKLNEILDLFYSKFKRFDLMSIDVEGYEINVLKDIDFSKYIIDYILVEELTETNEIKDLLNPYYIFCQKLTGHDYLYKRKNL